jgi:hypothetical protein
MVYFWTGRGSHGYGIIQRICSDKMFIDPEPNATSRAMAVPFASATATPRPDNGSAAASRMRISSGIAQLDQRTAPPDQCLHSAEADVLPQGGGRV